MERALEVTDNSSKLEDENASSYSAFFQLDNLQPSKKGQRESVSLHVKVNPLFVTFFFSCRPQLTWSQKLILKNPRWTDSGFLPLCTFALMDLLVNWKSPFISWYLFQMDGGYEFTTTLQIKIYNAKSTQHCDWGTTVHSIEYECHTDQQNNSIKIVKDTFR